MGRGRRGVETIVQKMQMVALIPIFCYGGSAYATCFILNAFQFDLKLRK